MHICDEIVLMAKKKSVETAIANYNHPQWKLSFYMAKNIM